MAAYIIARVAVTDPERYKDYAALTPDLIARHGGRFIVRGGAVETLEGGEEARRVVVIEFPDKAAAKAFYDDPDYQAAKAIRQSASTGDFALVEGVA